MLARLLISLLAAALFAAVSHASVTLTGAGSYKRGTGGGGGGVWTLVASGKGAGAGGGTSAALNTATSKLFVVTVACYAGSGGTCNTASDSSSNTWTRIGTGTVLNSFQFNIFYVISPTTSGSHTFTTTCASANCFAAMEVQAWTESGTPVFDVSNFGNAASSSTAAGSVTPTVNNSLLVTGSGNDGASTVSSIDTGFTKTDDNQFNSGVNVGGAIAYFQQSTAAAINPTWSATSATTFVAGIASFKP